MAARSEKLWTAGDLTGLPGGRRYEIDEGHLVVMEPAGFYHNDIATETARLLANHVHDRHLGKVLANELGVLLRRDPQTLRGVDVAYYSHERLARIEDREGFPEVPPDLVVEVHLPGEADMARKVGQYLAAGVRAVWVIDPRRQTLTRHAAGEAPRTWRDPDARIEEPVVPGFSVRLGDLLGED